MKRLQHTIFIAALFTLACARPGGAPVPVPERSEHAVGVVTLDFEDLSRITPANGSAPQQPTRKLVTEVWYPSVGPASKDETFLATLDPEGAPYPLVVFVHGSSSHRRASSGLARALARRGYVVAAADMPLTALTSPGGPTDRHADDETGDVRFLASALVDASRDATHPLFGAVDVAAGHVVMGHSTGGTVALAEALRPDHDPRLRAAVAMAPCACFFGDYFLNAGQTPTMILAGTNDHFVPPETNGVRAYALARNAAVLGLLVGGDHLRFTDLDLDDFDAEPTTNEDDLALAFARYGGGQCRPAPPPGHDPAMTGEEQQRLTASASAAFLDAHMKGRTAALDALLTGTEPALRLSSRP